MKNRMTVRHGMLGDLAAYLKHGGGDVVLQKADGGWWRIMGFIKEGDHEDDKG